MKIGFDIHGVIDEYPDKYRDLINALIEDGVEIHILTGMTESKAIPILEEHQIVYDHFYSIADKWDDGVHVKWDEDGNPHMDEFIWNSSKGLYCAVHGIDIMIDDSIIYGKYMPNGTLYLQQWK